MAESRTTVGEAHDMNMGEGRSGRGRHRHL